jgi:hypothetical protein
MHTLRPRGWWSAKELTDVSGLAISNEAEVILSPFITLDGEIFPDGISCPTG